MIISVDHSGLSIIDCSGSSWQLQAASSGLQAAQPQQGPAGEITWPGLGVDWFVIRVMCPNFLHPAPTSPFTKYKFAGKQGRIVHRSGI